MPHTLHHLIATAAADIGHLDARLLLAEATGLTSEHCLAHGDRQASFSARWRFRSLVRKRRQGVPLAYLTGHKAFFGFDFLVNKYTLIPRPDTEVLVEAALEDIQKYMAAGTPPLLIDIGTGSGCIPIAILKTLPSSNFALPPTVAIDISRPALHVARSNAKIHDVPITFLSGSLFEPILKKYNSTTLQPYNHIVITANLPYLTQAQFEEEPSIQHEPKTALVAHNNGLALYETLLQEMEQFASRFPVPITSYFEIDPSQSHALPEKILARFPQASIEIKRDLAGLARVIICHIS